MRGLHESAADGEGDREPLGDAGDQLEQRGARFECRRDVEEHELSAPASE